ncbi:transcription factor bHLH94-like [Malania oleifera]|uniref:transcription factor bHLH94-like n=1 Tax=Malania oleifera TaxID=397392 RepID=UPI0025ADA9E4|nr:transcription factor bHLH94-like [Malania oleifera]
MALEAVVFPQYPFGYAYRDFYTLGAGGGCSYDLDLQDENKSFAGILDHGSNWDALSSPSVIQHVKELDHTSSPEACTAGADQFPVGCVSPDQIETPAAAAPSRRKRRRTKSSKNKEEVENQRMTHIAVERNRRKQMNEYLAVLRSLMPPSYVQRGDQASIIGGAINFVKELEQFLQSAEAQKRTNQQPNNGLPSSPFSDFFSFPQYSAQASHCGNPPPAAVGAAVGGSPTGGDNRWGAADIEVTMVESHANIKIRSKRRPKQLLKMVAGFHTLRLSVLHLNVTTLDQMVLYSISVRAEEGCQLTTVDDIAAAANQMLRRIDEEASLS